MVENSRRANSHINHGKVAETGSNDGNGGVIGSGSKHITNSSGTGTTNTEHVNGGGATIDEATSAQFASYSHFTTGQTDDEYQINIENFGYTPTATPTPETAVVGNGNGISRGIDNGDVRNGGSSTSTTDSSSRSGGGQHHQAHQLSHSHSHLQSHSNPHPRSHSSYSRNSQAVEDDSARHMYHQPHHTQTHHGNQHQVDGTHHHHDGHEHHEQQSGHDETTTGFNPGQPTVEELELARAIFVGHQRSDVDVGIPGSGSESDDEDYDDEEDDEDEEEEEEEEEDPEDGDNGSDVVVMR
ncbi:unnamed protein product [Ambrosiozyma monospora]|uniref:Unnamed protein product n=1 Tax=Ambrosiozyma monospora TaxID=43982 RepID=A0ACB5TJH8_AMBMO|nr:unnamed protein product [Ambrosiozyma monospora]